MPREGRSPAAAALSAVRQLCKQSLASVTDHTRLKRTLEFKSQQMTVAAFTGKPHTLIAELAARINSELCLDEPAQQLRMQCLFT